jgi:SAM-dependent methyltransferase
MSNLASYLLAKGKSEMGFLKSQLGKALEAIGVMNALTQPPQDMLTEWKKLSDIEAAKQASQMATEHTLVFSDKASIRTWVFEKELQASTPGLVLEFGVHVGESLRQIAAAGHHVFGFDAFQGLRDSWSKPGRGIGAMDLGGEIPKGILGNPNISIVKGWVEDTVPGFLEEHKDTIKLAHLDLDVGPPTRFVLSAILDRLVPGSLLVFDDFFGHIGWENHSFSAFKETCPEESFLVRAISPKVVVFERI